MAADDHLSNHKQGKTTATGAVSPGATKKPKERVPVKPELSEINQYLMCSLCSGYLIDATAIIECQHTFCKSCILTYIEEEKKNKAEEKKNKNSIYCPICDIELNTVKPHLSLRSDVIVQKLVYKLVPGLLVSELRRRREHKGGKEDVKGVENVSEAMALEVTDLTNAAAAAEQPTILSLDDVVSLSIEYFTSSLACDEKKANQPLMQKKGDQPAIKCEDPADDDANDRRYLKCPAAVSVGLLKKFIRMKYGLSDDYRVDLLYNGDRDNSLESDLTLLDVAFIYKWNKAEPMRLHYRIFDKNTKAPLPRAGTKRSASSMMDEPPDDDAASGPQNRPSMTSASPSSKIPRVSSNSSTGATNNAGNTGGSARTTSSHHSPVYDFSEGNSDAEEPVKGKLTLKGYRKNSVSVDRRLKRSPSSSTSKRGSPGRSSSIGTQEDSDTSEDAESDSSSEDEEKQLTNSRVMSAAQTVLQSQVNGGIKLNLSSLGHEKLSIASAIAKSLDHKHRHKHHKMKHKKKHKPIKISLSLSPKNAPVISMKPNQSIVSAGKPSEKNKAVKVCGEKGPSKPSSGKHHSKHSKEEGKANSNGPSGNANSQSNFPVTVKPTTSAHLSNISKSISVSIGVGNNNANAGERGKTLSTLPKNGGIEIQQTTIQHNNSHPNVNTATVTQGSRSHPLLPDSVHVPKSVTLIPVNPPTTGNNSNSNATSTNQGANTGGKVGEKSGPSTSNRLNAHTFVHPRTNKSLHQITVTEIEPPKSGNPVSSAGSASVNNNLTVAPSPAPNPIEKVISNAASKPQFNGPGSMEITKIYCNTKENPAKKLKERKGLDISITVPQTKEQRSKSQDGMRHKIVGGMEISNKIKGVAQPGIFNAKMPPGITIGPAGGNKPNITNSSNSNKAISGLGFTLPPHITAHPQQTLAAKSGIKVGEKAGTNNMRLGNKAPLLGMNKGMKEQPKMMANNKKQLGDALASMMDMANRTVLNSPPPPKGQQGQPNMAKDTKAKGQNPEKRSLEMSSMSRKNFRDSSAPPEQKRLKVNEGSSSGGKNSSEIPLDLSGRNSRPNSTSPTITIPSGSNSNKTFSSGSEIGKKHQQQEAKKPATPVPKVSPPSSSPKSNSASSNPNSPSILSIVQNLAQKQLNQQQQQKDSSGSLQHQMNQHMRGNSLSPKGGSRSPLAGSGLNSLSPPIISMPNPSPPSTGFDPLRNLLTLSNASAAHHGKMHMSQMNQMSSLAAMGFSGIPHTHHGLSLPSPGGVAAGSLFAHFGGGKAGAGMMEEAQAHARAWAAISAHHERMAGLAHYGDSLSFLRPPSSSGGNLRVPQGPPKPSSSSSSSPGNNSSSSSKKGSPTPPLSFSHPPTVSSSHSPTKTHSSTSPASHSNKASEPVKNPRVNGTSFSSHLPILPPGIHNPLMPPSYARGANTSSSSSSPSAPKEKVNKGIPNSMKISNFLPSKPKDAKASDGSSVEATITSGSSVGGSNLSKFLNSIQPLVVSKDSSSPSSVPKTVPVPIKEEAEKAISQCHSGQITCQPKPSTPKASESLKSGSPEIKSEGSSLMGSRGETAISVGLSSPPSARTTPAQPQNQAVRHIPNPALLFHRQSSTATSPNSETSKSLPFGPNKPVLKLEEQGLQVPALPFPGVSVPVQVKVDSDAAPIPVVVEESAKSEEEPQPVVDTSKVKVEVPEEGEAEATPEQPNLEHESASPVIESAAEQEEAKKEETETTQVGKEEEERQGENGQVLVENQEEIVQIDNTEEGDLDIDVGTESDESMQELTIHINPEAEEKEEEVEESSSAPQEISEDKQIESAVSIKCEIEVSPCAEVPKEKERDEGCKESRESEASEERMELEEEPAADSEAPAEKRESETFPEQLELEEESIPMELEQVPAGSSSEELVEQVVDEKVEEETPYSNPEAEEMRECEEEGDKRSAELQMEEMECEEPRLPQPIQMETGEEEILEQQPLLPTEEESSSEISIQISQQNTEVAPTCDTDTDIQQPSEKSSSSATATAEPETEPEDLQLDLNQIEIILNPDALQVASTNPMEFRDENVPTVCEEEKLDSLGEEEEKLMESSSGSQLELNCPSEETNNAGEVDSSSNPSQVAFQEELNQSNEAIFIAAEEQQIIESTSPTTISALVERILETVTNQTTENESGESTANEAAPSSSVPELITIEDEESEESRDKSSLLQIDTSCDSSNSPALISATATITTTTTTAEMTISSGNEEVAVDSLESPTSSRNSLESPTQGMKDKMEEALEEAAGLFVSAANSINNNNNKSLTITAPTCEIPIATTTKSSDVATV